MFNTSWMAGSLSAVLMVATSTLLIYVSIILLSKLFGPRSFSQMSGFDFAVTIAIGSVLATTILSKDPSVIQGITAITGLFVLQMLVAIGRRRFKAVERTVDHPPLLLMAGTRILWDNMRRAQITQDDLWAQLREANIINLDTVRAVVLETAGDVTVLHSDKDDAKLDAAMLSGVLGNEQLAEVSQALVDHAQTPPYRANQ